MRVLFFAQLKDATGCAEVDWSVSDPLSSDAVWMRLLREFPALGPHRPCARLARNGAYTTGEEEFQPGDEVALIPPVSGG